MLTTYLTEFFQNEYWDFTRNICNTRRFYYFLFYSIDWEQRKLGEVAEIKDSARIPNTKWSDSGVPYIRASDLSNNDLSGVLFLDENIYEEYRKQTGSPKQGDVIFNGGGEIGKSMLKLDNRPIYVQGGAVLYVQTSKSFLLEGEYLNTYFSTPGAKKYMEVASAGGTMKHFTLAPSKEMPIVYPKTDEQEKIGKYFQNLDHLITLHQRKLKLLKQLKQAYLQQMFPQNDKKVPQLRFANFSGNWEQRKLGDVAKCSKGNGYSKSDLTETGTPIVLYGRLYTKYQFVIDDVDTFSTVKDGAVFSKGNEVLVPASGENAQDIARASAVVRSGVLLGGDLNLISPCDFINSLFLALAISNGEPQKELAKKAQGKSVVHIHNSDIQVVNFSYPTKQEQDRIVTLFRILDNLTALHQKKLGNLKQIKTAYLKSMFI